MTKRLDILLFKECNHQDDGCDQWVAQCLQHDIVGQGETIEDALFGLEACLVGHLVIDAIKKREPLEWIPTAPKKYWDKFSRANQVVEEQVPSLFESEDIRANVPPAFMIPEAPERHIRVY